MKNVLKKLVPNQFLEEYRKAKLKLKEAKEDIISNITDNKRNIDDTDEDSELKKGKKERKNTYSSFFSAALAITAVTIGIVGVTGGLAAPFVFAALALDVIAAAVDIHRVVKERRKAQKNNKKGLKDEENTVATQESLSDTMSISSEEHIKISNENDKSYPLSLLKGLEGDGKKSTKKPLERRPRRNQKNSKNTSNGLRLGFPFGGATD